MDGDLVGAAQGSILVPNLRNDSYDSLLKHKEPENLPRSLREMILLALITRHIYTTGNR